MNTYSKKMMEKIVDWATRERHIERYLIGGGLACITPAINWGSAISVTTKIMGYDVDLSLIPSLPELLQCILIVVGSILFVIGALIAVIRYRHNRADNDRKIVFVIELRGLRDTTNTPLVDATPKNLIGRRESILVDIRERIKDGVVTDPEKALERVFGLSADLERRHNGMAASDISTVYGGLSPVPFTFLTGLLLDDESHITVLDWDRSNQKWRQLDEIDDDESFVVSGEDSIGRDTIEIAMAISVSYGVDIASVSKLFPNMPVVKLQLSKLSTDTHWSEDKQRRLASEFLSVAIRAESAGIKKINLFIAAPNSLVFRFGRVYDKRNLPRIFVYQYQKGRDIEHPWAVDMPVHDDRVPQIKYSQSPS